MTKVPETMLFLDICRSYIWSMSNDGQLVKMLVILVKILLNFVVDGANSVLILHLAIKYNVLCDANNEWHEMCNSI